MVRSALITYKESFSGLSREIWLLSLVMLINRMGAMVLPFMSMYLTTELHFTLSDAGIIMGAYGAGSILGAYSGGVLTDKYNYYYVQLGSLLGGSFLLFALPFLHSFWSIACCIFLFSLISDSLRPANSVAIAAYSSDDNRVRSFSLMRLSINLGFAVGPALGGLILVHFGYQWIFIFDGITCILAAILIMLYLPFKNTSNIHEKDDGPKVTQTLSAYKDTKYLVFIVMVMFYATLFFQLFTTVPVFLKKESGYSESLIGLFMALNGLLIALFEMPVIQRLEKKSNTLTFITWGFYLLAISFAFLLLDEYSIIFTFLYVIMITASEVLTMPFMLNFAIARSSKSRQGQYMALYSMAYGMAHILAPTISMYVAEVFSFRVLYLLVIFLAMAGGIWFFSKLKVSYW
jgi:predicted MFS family arabinose efflux permease